ncbi:MAG: sigma-70 family RNA polymerase sigma factor [Fuerstiella sp.]|nr:sigma-70 family RNA polymerase sigma factor [Fuerstiella sp.]MCP4784396.1 sigma-70 family RNA polymerase sigma factor [Fuerstiella sp.]MCP4853991.1 sigma-70 family RNA polymerase sigma factor [Fuerstiella sp.]
MKTKGHSSTSELIHSCQGLVRSIAWKIHQRLPGNIDLDDLVGFGQIGLAEAARDFDQTRGVQFTTYAYYRVRGAILDGLSTMAWFTKADYQRGRYERAANDVLETAPDKDTADDDTNWFGRTARSLSMTYLMTQWSGENADLESSDMRSPSEAAEATDLQGAIRQLVDGLPEQEQNLIRGIYFEGLSIKEAGERIGVSKAWASRLHARTLESLAFRLADEHD